jgi:hypothetical protein
VLQNEAQATEATMTDPAPSESRASPRKSRPHNYIVISRKQKEALLHLSQKTSAFEGLEGSH